MCLLLLTKYNCSNERKYIINKRNKAEKAIKPPNLPKQGLEKGLPDDTLQDYAQYTQLTLSLDDFTGQEAQHISFDQILLQSVVLSKSRFKKVQMLNGRRPRFHALNYLAVTSLAFKVAKDFFKMYFSRNVVVASPSSRSRSLRVCALKIAI